MAAAIEALPDDYFVTSMQFTKHTHHDIYDAIDPAKNPKLSLAGKVVIITGASRGIGARGIVPIIARAEPKAIVLVATKADGLKASEELIGKISPEIKILAVGVDLSSPSSVANLFEKVKQSFGYANVLINNAGVNEGGGLLHEEDDDVWWRNFEVNSRGSFLLYKRFIAALPSTDAPASIVNLVTGGAWLVLPHMSGYSISKLASLQTTTFLAATYPSITAVSLHPGLVESDMHRPEFKHFEKDTPELVGGVTLWLSSPEAHFLSGRAITTNWDVQDLVARKEEIMQNGLLQMQLNGKFGKEQFD